MVKGQNSVPSYSIVIRISSLGLGFNEVKILAGVDVSQPAHELIAVFPGQISAENQGWSGCQLSQTVHFQLEPTFCVVWPSWHPRMPENLDHPVPFKEDKNLCL